MSTDAIIRPGRHRTDEKSAVQIGTDLLQHGTRGSTSHRDTVSHWPSVASVPCQRRGCTFLDCTESTTFLQKLKSFALFGSCPDLVVNLGNFLYLYHKSKSKHVMLSPWFGQQYHWFDNFDYQSILVGCVCLYHSYIKPDIGPNVGDLFIDTLMYTEIRGKTKEPDKELRVTSTLIPQCLHSNT